MSSLKWSMLELEVFVGFLRKLSTLLGPKPLENPDFEVTFPVQWEKQHWSEIERLESNPNATLDSVGGGKSFRPRLASSTPLET